MKTQIIYWVLGAMIVMVCFAGCGSDDEEQPREIKTSYAMGPVSNPEISGTITFTKIDAASTLVTIELNGTASGDVHPTHIHANAASEGGPIVIDLNSVDGATGISETTVTQLDDGTAITYEGLLSFDGHANVHLSPAMMSTLIAQGNVGSNHSGGNGGGDGNGDGNGGY